MTYLWLNGTRIDSIPLLRSYLKNCDKTDRASACFELLKKYKAGALAGWIARQVEAQPSSELLKAKNMTSGVQPSRIHELLDTPLKGTQDALPILAELCMIELCDMEKMLDGVLDETEDLGHEIFDLIKMQHWYKESKQIQELLNDVDQEFIITDMNGFNMLADRYRFSEKNNTRQYTVYLCNTGSHFQLSNPNRYWNLRIVGCGKPVIRFGSQNRGQKLDMELHDLFFQDVTLQLQGMILSGNEGRLPGVDLR